MSEGRSTSSSRAPFESVLSWPSRSRHTRGGRTTFSGARGSTGKIIYGGGPLPLVIRGGGAAFEPVPAERPDDATVQFVHPVDVFYAILDQAEGETDIQIAIESSAA